MAIRTVPAWRRPLAFAAAMLATVGLLAPTTAPAESWCEDFDGKPYELSEYETFILFPGRRLEDLNASVRIRTRDSSNLRVYLRHYVEDAGAFNVRSIPLFVGVSCANQNYPEGEFFEQDIALYFDDAANANIVRACDYSIPSVTGNYAPHPGAVSPCIPPVSGAEELGNGMAFLEQRNTGLFELIVCGGAGSSLVEWCVTDTDFNGDVSPREQTQGGQSFVSGNGLLSITDWVETGLFILGDVNAERLIAGSDFAGYSLKTLDLRLWTDSDIWHANESDDFLLPDNLDLGPMDQTTATYLEGERRRRQSAGRGSGHEFARLDGAPVSSSGDGRVTVADWVQSGRFADGLDEASRELGPISPIDRIVRVANEIIPRGLTTPVSVRMLSKGTEHEVGMTIEYNPDELVFEGANRGDCVPENANFELINEVTAGEGRIGLQIGLLPDQTFLCDFDSPLPLVTTAAESNPGVGVGRARMELARTARIFTQWENAPAIGNLETNVVEIGLYASDVSEGWNVQSVNASVCYSDSAFTYLGLIDESAGTTYALPPTETVGGGTVRLAADNAGSTLNSATGTVLLYRMLFEVDPTSPNLERAYITVNDTCSDCSARPAAQVLFGARALAPADPARDYCAPIFGPLSSTLCEESRNFYTTYRDSFQTQEIGRGLSGASFGLVMELDGTPPAPANNCAVGTTFPVTISVRQGANGPVVGLTDFNVALSWSSGLEFVSGTLGSDLDDIGTLDSTTGANGGTFSLEPTSPSPTENVRVLFTATMRVAVAAGPEGHNVQLSSGSIQRMEDGSNVTRTPFISANETFTTCFGVVGPIHGRAGGGEFAAIQFVSRLTDISCSGGEAQVTMTVSVEGNTSPMRSINLPVSYNAYQLELASLTINPQFGSAMLSPIVDRDGAADYTNRMLSGTSTGDFTNGVLATLVFNVNRIPSTPPSFYITQQGIIQREVELATLKFRPVDGRSGTLAENLVFTDDLFASRVRNAQGRVMYGHFVTGGVTILDFAESQPAVRVVDTVLENNIPGTVQIAVDAPERAGGFSDVNSVGFVLKYRPDDIRLNSVSRGRHVPSDAFFYTNPNENSPTIANDYVDDEGFAYVSFLIGLQPGRTFASGARIVANLNFTPNFDTMGVTDPAVETPLFFVEGFDRPGVRNVNSGVSLKEVVNPLAIPLVSRFPDGKVTVSLTCTYTLAAVTPPDVDAGPGVAVEFPTAGGEGMFDVITESGCPWIATTTADWIELIAGASNFDTGTVTYRVMPNDGPARMATIEVVGREYVITQAACDFAVQPTEQTFSGEGGTGSFEVITDESCSWTAMSDVSWVQLVAPPNPFGTGNGLVRFSVDANVGQSRVGTITVTNGDRSAVFTVRQRICTYGLTPASPLAGPNTFAPIPAGGGVGSFNVVTTDDTGASADFCPWEISVDVDWLIITNAVTGVGPATINFVVEENLTGERVATISMRGRSLIVRQLGLENCDFSIDPDRLTFPATTGTGSFDLTAPAGCPWQVTKAGDFDAEWVTITSPLSGSGSTTVSYNLAANPDISRSATIMVGGQTHTITQFGGAEFTFDFVADTDGWLYQTFTPTFSAPAGSHVPGPTGASQRGRLVITATDNVNNFGLWRSPALRLQTPVEAGNTFEAAWELTSTTTQALAPTARLRISSSDFAKSDVYVVSSTGNGSFSPTSAGRTYRQIFNLPVGEDQFQAFFELLNFDPNDAANGDLRLERIIIRPFDTTTLSDPRSLLSELLSEASNQALWSSSDATPLFVAPEFSSNERGLTVVSASDEEDVPTTVGFWNRTTNLTLGNNRVMRVSFKVSSRARQSLEVRKSRVPTFRVRLNDSAFKGSVYTNIESIDDDSPVPTFFEPQTYDVWFIVPGELVGNRLNVSFDYLLTNQTGVPSETRNDPSIIMILESVQVDSWELPTE